MKATNIPGSGFVGWRIGLIAVLVCAISIWPNMAPVHAESPSPNATMRDAAPGSTANAGAQVVEGLGMLACSYSLSSVEQQTINDLAAGYHTITEISPQSGCGSISQYENLVQTLINYVEAHGRSPGTNWGGVMLDEEDGFGFSPAQIEDLNNHVAYEFLSTAGISYYYTEDFSVQGVWSQSDYNAIVGLSFAAPQIYTSYMVSLHNNYLANNCTGDCTLVTWWTGSNYPYNSEAGADNAINYGAYYQWGVFWDNQFQ